MCDECEHVRACLHATVSATVSATASGTASATANATVVFFNTPIKNGFEVGIEAAPGFEALDEFSSIIWLRSCFDQNFEDFKHW